MCRPRYHYSRNQPAPEKLVGDRSDDFGQLRRAGLSCPGSEQCILGEAVVAQNSTLAGTAGEFLPVTLTQSILDESVVLFPRLAVIRGKHSQGQVGCHPWQNFPAEVGMVPAPGVVIRVFFHAGADGVEVDIADQFEQVAVLVDQQRFVPALEEVALAVSSTIDPAGVAKGQILHQTGKGNGANLKSEINDRSCSRRHGPDS